MRRAHREGLLAVQAAGLGVLVAKTNGRAVCPSSHVYVLLSEIHVLLKELVVEVVLNDEVFTEEVHDGLY